MFYEECQYIQHRIHSASMPDLDVCFNLYAKLLKVLNNRTVNSATEVGVLVSNDTSLISDSIINILQEQSVSIYTLRRRTG